jgi:hypothetical protein
MAPPQPLLEAIDGNYARMRRWFERSLDHVWRLPPELRAAGDPIERVAEIEASSPAMASNSLAQGISDTVALTYHYPAEDIARIDALFTEECLPKLSWVRALCEKNLARILKRDEVADQQEYDYLKGFEIAALPEQTRERIERLIGAYEISRR